MKFAPNGVSKIQIEFNSKFATLDAINFSEVEIKTADLIKVVKVENDNIYIEKV